MGTTSATSAPTYSHTASIQVGIGVAPHAPRRTLLSMLRC
jgi:hypothetical protein